MENIVTLTSKAIAKIQEIASGETDESKGLRLAVVGGGCSGFSYKMDFDFEKEKDNVLSYDGFNVFIDPKSAIYLKGITLDFKDGLNGKGFTFDNPNAKNTCGCGESFTI